MQRAPTLYKQINFTIASAAPTLKYRTLFTSYQPTSRRSRFPQANGRCGGVVGWYCRRAHLSASSVGAAVPRGLERELYSILPESTKDGDSSSRINLVS